MKYVIHSLMMPLIATLLGGGMVMAASPLYAQQTVPVSVPADDIPIVNIPIPMKYISPSIAPFRISTRVPSSPQDPQARQRYADAEALRLKGISLFVMGRTQAAIDTLNQASVLWPDSAEVYHWLAESYTANGQNDQAIKNYRLLFYGWPSRAPRAKPNALSQNRPSDKPSDYNILQPEEVDPRLWLQFSLLLQQTGQHEEAVTAYNSGRQCLATHPMISPGPLPPLSATAAASPMDLEAATRVGLAIAERAKIANDDATRDLDQALDLQPNLAVAHFYRGEMLKNKSGRSAEALAEFSKAAQYGGFEMRPYLGSAFQFATPEFKATLKKAGLTAQ